MPDSIHDDDHDDLPTLEEIRQSCETVFKFHRSELLLYKTGLIAWQLIQRGYTLAEGTATSHALAEHALREAFQQATTTKNEEPGTKNP